MKLFNNLAAALAVCIFSSAAAFSFECTGDGQCEIIIDGVDQACLTAIEIFTGPLTGSGPIKLAICDYKSLDGVCFSLELPKQSELCQIKQTEEQPGLFRYEYTSNVEATVPGYPGVFSGWDPLTLESVNLSPYELGNDPNPVTYRVNGDVLLSNGLGNDLVLRDGSSVSMLTKKPKIICDLTGRCYIEINGNGVNIDPIITIESEEPVDNGGVVRVGLVTAKQLVAANDIVMTLGPDFAPSESYFMLERINANDPFPANVSGFFWTQIEHDGEIYRSNEALEVKSAFPVNEWPPAAGTATYYVAGPVQYVSDSGNVIVVMEGEIRN